MRNRNPYQSHQVSLRAVRCPIIFLIYINDPSDEVCSQVRLFADYTALYLTMESENDGSTLQNDLDILSIRWDMEFHPSKCQVVNVTGSKRDYILPGQVLKPVTCAKYLGVDISGSLTWNSHIDRITGSASRTLGFVRRNIKTKMSKVCEMAYTTLVRPQLKYASAVWDPHTKKRISKIEQVQQRAARWTVSNFDRQASVTKIVLDLGWRTLDQRRANARLCLFLHGNRTWCSCTTVTESLGRSPLQQITTNIPPPPPRNSPVECPPKVCCMLAAVLMSLRQQSASCNIPPLHSHLLVLPDFSYSKLFYPIICFYPSFSCFLFSAVF